MKRVLMHRPSPSMVVALAALLIAVSGTAVAATSALVSGDKLIKKNSLSGNRLRNHTVAGTQINLSMLGKVPRAKKADAANTATNATHATSADSATVANGLPALTWQTLTLLNGWTGGPFSSRTPAVAVDAQGIVHFRGAMSQSATFNPSAFQLPAALDPSAAAFVTVDMCNATVGRLIIAPNGAVTVQAETSSSNAQCFTSLDGASYALG